VPDRPVRVALIGYGRAGRALHTPLIRATSGLDLAMVASSRPQQVRADLPQVTVTPTPSDVWADASIDLVVVATPPATHVELAAAALAAGRHVVVDKPLAVSLEDARQLAAAAARSGRMLATFQNRRWDGDFLAVTDLVRSRTLGDVSHFESHFDRYRPEVRDRWRERPGPGSGVWSDLGPHLVDQALRLFGVPESVDADLAALRAGASTDDWAHVILTYARCRVVLHASMLVAANRLRFAVHGTRGSWVKQGLDPQELQLAAQAGLEVGTPPLEFAVLVDGATGLETEVAIPAGDYGRFYADVRDAVRDHGPNPVPPAQAIGTVAVVETAARSASASRPLPIPLTPEERAAAGI
jgi:predicted dehydrogenase